MESPLCPVCQKRRMKIRKAKKGPHAGNYFWGCTGYPECRGIVNIEKQDVFRKPGKRIEWSSLPQTIEQILVRQKERMADKRFTCPRTVQTPVHRSIRTLFLESLTVPESVLPEWAMNESSSWAVRGFAQWRIQYPDQPASLSPEECAVLAVMEKILLRGRITLLTHQLEPALLERFPLPAETSQTVPVVEHALNTVGYRSPSDAHPIPRTSHSTRFFEIIFPEICRELEFSPSIVSGIELNQLLSPEHDQPPAEDSLLDALITHPSLNRGIAVFFAGNPSAVNKTISHSLESLGMKPLVVPTHELKKGQGQVLNTLRTLLQDRKTASSPTTQRPDHILKTLSAFKIAHQIQIALLLALRHGFLPWDAGAEWSIATDLDQNPLFLPETAHWLISETVRDFYDLRARVARIHAQDTPSARPSVSACGDSPPEQIMISFFSEPNESQTGFFIHDCFFPWPLPFPSFPVVWPEHLTPPDHDDLTYFLRAIFRKDHLREGQYQGVCRILETQDTLLLLPTGSGKSLVYQLASFLLPGRTLIVDPLIALMEDQVSNLRLMGIDRAVAVSYALLDLSEKKRVQSLFARGEYLFTFVSPERLQIEDFREKLDELRTILPIPLVVIDECHCISEWGHDFRLAYLNIGRITREYCRSFERAPALLGLTGTASQSVLKDVQRELAIFNPEAVITPRTFDRPELQFHIEPIGSLNKLNRLESILKHDIPTFFQVPYPEAYALEGTGTRSGLIFFPHVNGRYGVVENYDILNEASPVPMAFYSGKSPDIFLMKDNPATPPGQTEEREPEDYRIWKNWVTREFKNNRLSLLLVTKAFGLGIDKPNIRYTIHYGIPSSIESFYQEAGRAGRDRQPAYCWVIASNDHLERNRNILSPDTPLWRIAEFIKETPFHDQDDISRNLFFHVNSFSGVDEEINRVRKVLDTLGDTSQPKKKIITLSGLSRIDVEKALHRLLLIGCIQDYTIQYALDTSMVDHFTVTLSGASPAQMIQSYGQYVENYLWSRSQFELEKARKLPVRPHRNFIEKLIGLLVEFIYEVVEKGRRRALFEMVEVCAGPGDDQSVRQSILRYLEETGFSQWLDLTLQDTQAGMSTIEGLADYLHTATEAQAARGQVSRRLESYPDHPGLLLARALSEAQCPESSPDVIMDHVLAALESAREQYGIPETLGQSVTAYTLKTLSAQHFELTLRLTWRILNQWKERDLARYLIEHLPEGIRPVAQWALLNTYSIRLSHVQSYPKKSLKKKFRARENEKKSTYVHQEEK